MPRKPVAACRQCGQHRNAVGKLSRNGFCVECSIARMSHAVDSLRNGDGDVYERWEWRSGLTVVDETLTPPAPIVDVDGADCLA